MSFPARVSIQRISAIRSVSSLSPRGCNRATLLDLDAAIRTERRMRGAGMFLGSVERRYPPRGSAGSEARCMMKVSSAPRGRWGRTWSLLSPPSLSLSFPPCPALALSHPLLSRGSLSLSPHSFSLDTRCRNAAPMTLPRLPLLLLARTYSRVRDTRGTATVRHRCRHLGDFDPRYAPTGAFSRSLHRRLNSTRPHRGIVCFSDFANVRRYSLFPGVGSRGEINLGDRQSIGRD